MPPELSKEQIEAQQWATSCDPMQLVSVARKALHGDSRAKSDPYAEAATDEIFSRFELGARALEPTGVGTPVGSSSSSR